MLHEFSKTFSKTVTNAVDSGRGTSLMLRTYDCVQENMMKLSEDVLQLLKWNIPAGLHLPPAHNLVTIGDNLYNPSTWKWYKLLHLSKSFAEASRTATEDQFEKSTAKTWKSQNTRSK
mmetsp:Transcript_47453/g.115710  ORF Transcript_47453/g.115710 Transcript_47453/m.115710 type:complete len:118 (-) Transcript_47453:631-984(-)